ncbi:hypothetical protein Pla110_28300 [Polystyrenella longa]|uniref:Uncharacterized protein n=1 Tax=Polystyrenella longa TaxID=2528007 RepID=A0A518CPF8_9PLAN|nr:hypothetical protein [Polystyrenella longa]QDU81093.1 hypothetical protein Pla110_28300 [Polystyrenella longa]
MWSTIAETFTYYGDYYYDMVMYQWKHLTPVKYTIALFAILVFGWLLMKSGMRKPGS